VIRKIFENHSSDPDLSLSAHAKRDIFVLPHKVKALLELFCLQPNMIG